MGLIMGNEKVISIIKELEKEKNRYGSECDLAQAQGNTHKHIQYKTQGLAMMYAIHICKKYLDL